jgi:hypothetical protein
MKITRAELEQRVNEQAEALRNLLARPRVSPTDVHLEAHQLGLSVQAPTFTAALDSMIEFCQSWFSSVQGFDRDNFDGDCMLITTELAEAVEADRTKAKDQHVPEFEGRAVELADALVRLLHVAGKYKLPLSKAFIAKQHYNLTRPVKHGKEY